MPLFLSKKLTSGLLYMSVCLFRQKHQAGKRRQGKFYRVLSSVEWYLFSFDLPISCVRAPREESLLSTPPDCVPGLRSCIRSLQRGEVADKYNPSSLTRRNDLRLTMITAVYPFKARRVVVLFPRLRSIFVKVFMSLNHRRSAVDLSFRICQSRLVSCSIPVPVRTPRP